MFSNFVKRLSSTVMTNRASMIICVAVWSLALFCARSVTCLIVIGSWAALYLWLLSYQPRSDLAPDRPKRGLLHNKYHISKVPKQLDVVIIGSGMSGLSCAAMLSRMGKRCVVLEQHDICGGSTHTYDLKGYSFDSGHHYTVKWSPQIMALAGLSKKDVPHFPLLGEKDGTFERIFFGHNEPEFRMKHNEVHMKELIDEFPTEKAAIQQYIRYSNQMMYAVKVLIILRLLPKRLQYLAMPLLLSQATRQLMSMTSKQVLGDLLNMSCKLQARLCATWIDGGGRPDEITFMLTSCAFRGLSLEGACFPEGGSSDFASYMTPTIEKYGSRVLVKAAVESLLIVEEQKKCVGVRLVNGDEIYARQVVSSAGYLITMGKLLPSAAAQQAAIPDYIPGLGNSIDYVMLHIGVKDEKSAEEGKMAVNGGGSSSSGSGDGSGGSGGNGGGGSSDGGNGGGKTVKSDANIWYNPVTATDSDLWTPLQAYFNDPLSEAVELPLMITFPGCKDKTWRHKHPDKTSIQVLVPACKSWFDQWQNEPCEHRSDEYENYKQKWSDKILQQVQQLIPSLTKDRIDMLNVSTPLTIDHYLRHPASGLDHMGSRFIDWTIRDLLDPVTDFEGLYLTGHDTIIVGVTMAQLAGIVTAFRMEGFFNSVKALLQAILLLPDH